MQLEPKRADKIKLIDLEDEHIERIGEILDSLGVQEEIHPEHTISYLVDLWISEKQKGEGANFGAMKNIEGIVLEASGFGGKPIAHHSHKEGGGTSRSSFRHIIRGHEEKMGEGLMRHQDSKESEGKARAHEIVLQIGNLINHKKFDSALDAFHEAIKNSDNMNDRRISAQLRNIYIYFRDFGIIAPGEMAPAFESKLQRAKDIAKAFTSNSQLHDFLDACNDPKMVELVMKFTRVDGFDLGFDEKSVQALESISKNYCGVADISPNELKVFYEQMSKPHLDSNYFAYGFDGRMLHERIPRLGENALSLFLELAKTYRLEEICRNEFIFNELERIQPSLDANSTNLILIYQQKRTGRYLPEPQVFDLFNKISKEMDQKQIKIMESFIKSARLSLNTKEPELFQHFYGIIKSMAPDKIELFDAIAGSLNYKYSFLSDLYPKFFEELDKIDYKPTMDFIRAMVVHRPQSIIGNYDHIQKYDAIFRSNDEIKKDVLMLYADPAYAPIKLSQNEAKLLRAASGGWNQDILLEQLPRLQKIAENNEATRLSIIFFSSPSFDIDSKFPHEQIFQFTKSSAHAKLFESIVNSKDVRFSYTDNTIDNLSRDMLKLSQSEALLTTAVISKMKDKSLYMLDQNEDVQWILKNANALSPSEIHFVEVFIRSGGGGYLPEGMCRYIDLNKTRKIAKDPQALRDFTSLMKMVGPRIFDDSSLIYEIDKKVLHQLLNLTPNDSELNLGFLKREKVIKTFGQAFGSGWGIGLRGERAQDVKRIKNMMYFTNALRAGLHEGAQPYLGSILMGVGNLISYELAERYYTPENAQIVKTCANILAKNTSGESADRAFGFFIEVMKHGWQGDNMDKSFALRLSNISKIITRAPEKKLLSTMILNQNFEIGLLTEDLANKIVAVSNIVRNETGAGAEEYSFKCLENLVSNPSFEPGWLTDQLVLSVAQVANVVSQEEWKDSELQQRISEAYRLDEFNPSWIKDRIAPLINPDPKAAILKLEPQKRKAVRKLFNRLYPEGDISVSEVEETARTMAFAATKTQQTLQQISKVRQKPVVAAYVLSTGFGLRAPAPSMHQLDNQYAIDPQLLDRAAEHFFLSSKFEEQKKISMLKTEFLRQVKAKIEAQPAASNKLDEKSEIMRAYLSVASEWMKNNCLDSFVYQTAYKVASGAGGIKDGTTGAIITDRLGQISREQNVPIAIVDHSTVRTLRHGTVAHSITQDTHLGRALAQIAQRLKQSRPKSEVGWLTVNNNWSIGDLFLGKKPDIIAFNLYAGVEYASSQGARKSLWLPIDDRPFFVGREWNEENISIHSKRETKYMDKNYDIRGFDSTKEYWDAFSSRYRELESARRLDWAKPYAGKIILFDLDGTIIHTDHAVFASALEHAFEHLQKSISFGRFIRTSVRKIRQRYTDTREGARQTLYGFGRYRDMELRLYNTAKTLAGRFRKDEAVANMRVYAKEAYDIYWNERVAGTKVHGQAIKAMEEANAMGYKVVIMSDRRDSELHDILQTQVRTGDGSQRPLKDLILGAIVTNDLLSEIEVDVPICRLGLPKEKEAYRLVSQLVHPVMMVGDSRTHDIKPAEESGIPGVLVRHGKGYEKIIERLSG